MGGEVIVRSRKITRKRTFDVVVDEADRCLHATVLQRSNQIQRTLGSARADQAASVLTSERKSRWGRMSVGALAW